MSYITQLYPQLETIESIKGIYLSPALHSHQPCVYADVLSSLDGRIGINEATVNQLPKHLTSDNDFRLFLELQAHADCLITHSSYLRARAAKQLGDILTIGKQKDHEDILNWRKQQGLTDNYPIIVCSKSLDFPEPKEENIIIAACEQSPPQRIEAWRQKNYEVLIAGKHLVEAKQLTDILKQRGYKSIFFIAGPKLLSSAIKDSCLDFLYLTLSHQLIARNQFHTMIDGISGDLQHCRLEQTRLIYDASPLLTHKQWYASFQCHYEKN